MKVKYYRIAVENDENWCYVSEKELGATVLSFVEGMTVGYGVRVEPTYMTDKQFNKLPEYEG